MIWKRSAVLRFYSVCGLLLQGNPRPAGEHQLHAHSPSSPLHPIFPLSPSRSPGPQRCPPPPPTPLCSRGQWQFAPAPRIYRWLSPALPAVSPLRGTFRLFIHLSFLYFSLRPRHHHHHHHPPSYAFWLATCAFSEHSTLSPPPTSRFPHHAPDRPSPSLVISLTSLLSGRLSPSSASHHHHILCL